MLDSNEFYINTIESNMNYKLFINIINIQTVKWIFASIIFLS